MSLLYSTKSLGRTWVPSPARKSRGRFGTWPVTQQQYYQRTQHNHMAIRLRGKPWERIAIALILAFMFMYTVFWRHNGIGNISSSADRYLQSWRNRHRHIELADEVSWSNFAYCTYATELDHLCNSLLLLESLHRLQVKADRILLYSSDWDATNVSEPTGRLLTQAREQYGVNTQPIGILRADRVADPTWAAGFTKWLAFNQTQYRRVMTLDSDATILRSMDELFLMPSSPVAIPRAYWLANSLSAQVTLVTPSSSDFSAIQNAIANKKDNDYDMEIINNLYGDSCAIIPHRPYNLLTGEFRAETHEKYLGSKKEVWDAEKAMEEVKYVHFSDWPLPKPWVPHSVEMERELQPKCKSGEEDCANRRVWKWLYEDFAQRREAVCGAEFASWEPQDASIKADDLLGQEQRLAGGDG